MMRSVAIVLSFLSLTLAVSNSTSPEKRGGQTYYGDGTYFPPGMGACGIWNTGHDHIVALNQPQFGGGYPGKNCFRKVTIMHNGKTAEAEITDECPPPCKDGDLDMSPSLFEVFAITQVGRFPMSWYYNDDPPSKSTSAHHTTTTKETTTPKHTTTTHKSTTSTKPTATPTVTPGPGNNIGLLQVALLSMVEMAVAGASL